MIVHDFFIVFSQEIIAKFDKNVLPYAEKFDLLQKAWKYGSVLVEKCSKDASENILTKLLKHSWSIVLVVSEFSYFFLMKHRLFNTNNTGRVV